MSQVLPIAMEVDKVCSENNCCRDVMTVNVALIECTSSCETTTSDLSSC